jgi:RNA polymerase sigma factor (sigma-70 family)
MTKQSSHEYSNLRKYINTYIEKYPAPNRALNKERLCKLVELRPFIDKDKVKAEEYYKLRNIITLSNGGFAMKYVMRYVNILNDESTISELFNEATIGIMESIDTFDLKKKTSFTTYAYFHVRKRIIDFIKHNKIVRAPRDIARNMKHVNEIHGYLLASDGNVPTATEIKKALKKEKGIKLKSETIDNIMILLELNSAGYEESFVSEFTDQVSEEEDSDLFRSIELNILGCISKFTEQTQQAIKLRYGIGREYPHSPEEVKLLLTIKDEDLDVF